MCRAEGSGEAATTGPRAALTRSAALTTAARSREEAEHKLTVRLEEDGLPES